MSDISMTVGSETSLAAGLEVLPLLISLSRLMVADDCERDNTADLAFLMGRVMLFTDFLMRVLIEDAFDESLEVLDLTEDFNDCVERGSDFSAMMREM